MPTPWDSRRETDPSYTPIAERSTLVSEALTCIISGRPLPENLRASSISIARFASAEEGIRRILAGPSVA